MRYGAQLDWLNFFLADVRGGLGPYVGVFLLTQAHWDQATRQQPDGQSPDHPHRPPTDVRAPGPSAPEAPFTSCQDYANIQAMRRPKGPRGQDITTRIREHGHD